jgi:adenosine deaminase
MSILSEKQPDGFISQIPKVELHLHIEGAIPADTMLALIQRKEPNSSIRTLEDLQRRFTFTDFPHFLDTWRWKDAFITSERDFEEIAYQVLRDLAAQNVHYVEAHYAPAGYLKQGLTIQGITENLIVGRNRSFQDFGIRCEFILDVIREYGPAKGLSYLDAVTPYLNKGVIGIGLGGPEHDFPPAPYAEVYQEAKQRGFRLTAHAGEAAGAESIRSAIESLGVERIGHGLRAYEDPELVALLKERQIPLEMCVVSNLKTGVCKSVVEHPIRDYFEKGLLVTVNSDDPAMFNTSIDQEYRVIREQLLFTMDDLKQISFNGITASFLPEDAKNDLRTQFEQAWQPLLKNTPD